MYEKITQVWKKIKKGIIQLLEEKEENTQEDAGNITPAAQNPGLDCPQCGFRIQIGIVQLLSHDPVYCSSCGLKLTIDQEKSKGCLDELRKVSEAIRKAEKATGDKY